MQLLLAVAALEDLDIQSVDVKTAYLYGDLDEEIYMEQPEGFKLPGKENKVWRLRKTLYGLKQAGLSWWRTMTKSMLVRGHLGLCLVSSEGLVRAHFTSEGPISLLDSPKS